MAAPFLTKRISQGNTAAQVYSSGQAINYGIQIRLGTEATGRLAIGNANTVTVESSAATDGYQLAAGDSIWLPKEICGDLTSVWIIATVAAQNVYILAF